MHRTADFVPIAGRRASGPSYRVVAPGELDGTLTRAWQMLQAGSAAFSSPYFCPQFTRLVGEVRDDVRVALVEDDGRVVAFFPYQRSKLGFGRPVAGSLSDYHGVVALPGSEWRVPDLLRAARLTTWKFDHLVDPCGKFAAHVRLLGESPQIDLGNGYEHYVRGRRAAGSEVVSQTERRARGLAREHGEVVFALHDDAPDVWECLFRWKGAQYCRSGMTDPLAFQHTRLLLRRLCDERSPDFAGVLSSLRVGGRVAALHMGMRSRHVLHWWFPAYDPAYGKYSVGVILLLRLARAAADAGIRTIDLGKGQARYKQRLTTGSVVLQEGICERNAGYGSLAGARDSAVKIVRQMQQWIRR